MLRFLFVAYVILNVLDGLLTYAGVSTFGVVTEANPLIASCMVLVGVLPTIITFKSAAIGVGYWLYNAERFRSRPRAAQCCYGIANVFLLLLAVIPWIYALVVYRP